MAEKGDLSATQKNVDEEEDVFGYAGIDAITKAILRLYPSQKNHLQATAQCKFWLGGPDPLDYVSMLYNSGDESRGVPAHWHYVSFGFSDLHGDNRVHESTGAGQQSGFGFELTFRLKAKESDESAPMWPASLMNALARYVFQTGNTLNGGDHVPWNQPLDDETVSPIQHMMIVADPQLGTQHSSYGNFQFRQIIGVTESEMKAAQHWKGSGLLDCLSKVKEAGGPLFVTDMQRKKSIFDLDVKNRAVVISGVEKEGSNLGHVTVVCRWEDFSQNRRSAGSPQLQEQESTHSTVNLEFDLEAAELLPLVLKGRLLKGRYFMFQNIEGQVIIFVPSMLKADMVIVNEKNPIRSEGQYLQTMTWFHGDKHRGNAEVFDSVKPSHSMPTMTDNEILCGEKLIQEMSQKFAVFQHPHKVKKQLPMQISLGPPHVNITVLPIQTAT